MSKAAKQDQSSKSINERFNVTKNQGRSLHLRVLARRVGVSICYGFEHI